MLLVARDSSNAANFSGNWILDLSRTKNLPQGLDRCNMSVNQDQLQLKVETMVEGDLRPAQEECPASAFPQAGVDHLAA
jgi:hypothetical protein